MKLSPLLLLATLPLLAASCQTNLLTLEARGIVIDDAEGDLDSVNEENVDLTGYGLHAALMSPIVDVVVGIDQREYENSDTPELDVGLRKRLIDIWLLAAYIEANVRYGFDLDTGNVSEDYFGYSAGFGALVDLNESLFLNFRIMYDTTDIEGGVRDIDVDGLIGTVGIGIKF